MIGNGAILIISGPSGCGKSTLLKKLFSKIDNYYFSISTTTRKIRDGEMDGREYFFVSKKKFEKHIKNNNFLEYAQVHKNYYGTPLKPIYKALKKGKLVVFDIDVQGFETVRKKVKKLATSVFITTPNYSELNKRLTLRGTDSEDVIKRRLENAKKEIEYIDKYDYLIINDDLDKAAKELICIAKAAFLKAKKIDKKNFIKQWNK